LATQVTKENGVIGVAGLDLPIIQEETKSQFDDLSPPGTTGLLKDISQTEVTSKVEIEEKIEEKPVSWTLDKQDDIADDLLKKIAELKAVLSLST
jgi:hypothetical protein